MFDIEIIRLGRRHPLVYLHSSTIGHLKQTGGAKRVDLLSVDANGVVRLCGPEIVPSRRIRSIDVRAWIDKPCVTIRPILEAQYIIVGMRPEAAHTNGSSRDVNA